MGVVYRARDTKLRHDVAIKFLPRQIGASAEEHERFKIEAQAAAALNRPRIATIHAIEEVDGGLFIAMERVDGKRRMPPVNDLMRFYDDRVKHESLCCGALF